MINKVILLGNLGGDPEVRVLENGAKVCRFSVATNENYKDRNGEWQTNTQWHNVVGWRFLADKAERSLKKGSLVYIEGKLSHRKYQTNEGLERYVTEVVAAVMQPLERNQSPESAGFPGENVGQAPAPSNPVQGPTPAPENKTETLDEDDLPF